jgi:uncharacterized membrane protein YhiD involved in acid resistance
MPDWLTAMETESQSLSLPILAARMVAAALFGALIASVYKWKRRDGVMPPTFPLTLILLSVLIAMVTQVVGDHVARAFSLVGALSIVRFRTVVEDTQDIAFVIFSVVVGMAVGSGDLFVACLGTCVCIAIIALSMLGKTREETCMPGQTSLLIRTALGTNAYAAVRPTLSDFFLSVRMVAAETVRGGAAYEWTYQVQFRPGIDPKQVMDQLAKIDGVQSVSWKSDVR